MGSQGTILYSVRDCCFINKSMYNIFVDTNMAITLAKNNNVVKITSNTVQQTISNMIVDRDRIKKILVITMGDDGVYRVNSSKMKEEDRITMCEIAKQQSLNRLFGN